MKVITLDYSSLRRSIDDVICQVTKRGRKLYVVAIATAGVHVAECVMECTSSDAALGVVKCTRPSTNTKKNKGLISLLFNKVIGVLPVLALDLLRIFEHRVLSRRKGSSIERVITEVDIDKKLLREADYVLIVDDAVDSGASLKKVLEYIEGLTTADVGTFSIVVTQGSPLIEPDYYIYRDVLVRFPWSMDYQK